MIHSKISNCIGLFLQEISGYQKFCFAGSSKDRGKSNPKEKGLFRNKQKYIFPSGLGAMYRFICLCAVTLFFQTETYSVQPDWSVLQTTDTLDLIMNGMHSGQMFETTNVLDKKKTITRNGLLVIVSTTKSGKNDTAMALTEKRVYGFDGRIRSVVQVVRSPSGTNSWRLLPSKDKNQWELRISVGGVTQTKQIPRVHETLYNYYHLLSSLLKSGINKGDVFYDTIYDVTSAQHIQEIITCTETPSKENKFRWVFSTVNSIESRKERWEIDTLGTTVFQEVPPFVFKKSAEEQPLVPNDGNSIFNLFKVPVSENYITNDYICLEMDSGLTPDSSVHTFYKQKGSKWVVAIPHKKCNSNSQSETYPDSLFRYLEPTTTMQSNHHDITSLAKQLEKKTKKGCSRIAYFTDYVSEKIRNKNTATFSSALETLRAGFGDCGEHAVLLAALLRASGIPARIVLGLVYLPSEKAYFYHAWVMQYSNGWIFADPALGEFPASANRIPLIIDDTGEKGVLLSKFINRIEITSISESELRRLFSE